MNNVEENLAKLLETENKIMEILLRLEARIDLLDSKIEGLWSEKEK